MDDPGPLLASGRAADVFDLGDGTVLRRYRTNHDAAPEAEVMRWARLQGLAVPVVHHAAGRDLVMERVDGPTMLDDLGSRPWRMIAHARLLADLQAQLNCLDAPPHLDQLAAAPGTNLVHLDLHPMNVILSPAGPVVIDWTNARAGDPGFDAANTYVTMAAFEVTRLHERVGRRVLLRTFAARRGEERLRSHLAAACDRRLADPNTTPGERQVLAHLRADPPRLR